eukprot:CAMPEP_0204382872 /NCGR_PEP_ID=MMETSP0469-20131031/55496_1 /ASSEMBLY_ACC=CAM_ASM_000384 /TAXON_ID=2969 /ORGANISM="Oxyrrhis marina" /LENGTH=209 /DNA_ID=CAMNT_0051375069 /DNA_START=1 /DNA_END=628 /DNA_ORIENTATION=+
MSKKVFVTVGTTLFDALVHAVDDMEFHKLLASQGYTELVIQYGRGAVPKLDKAAGSPLSVEAFSLKPTLKDDFRTAALVISHAGAGSIMEALRAKRPLITVVNSSLMGNHQLETAVAFEKLKCLVLVESPDKLFEAVKEVDLEALEEYPEPDLTGFNACIAGLTGVHPCAADLRGVSRGASPLEGLARGGSPLEGLARGGSPLEGLARG